MRFSPLSLLYAVGCVVASPELQRRGLTPVEQAYRDSFSVTPSRARLEIEEPPVAPAPYVVLETATSSTTLKRAEAGSLYEVRGVVRQLSGILNDYEVAIKDLPEGVRVQESEITDENAFKLTFSIDANVERGSYPFRVVGTQEGLPVFELTSVIPVDTEIDVIKVAAYNDFHGYIVSQNGSASQGLANKFTGALSMTFRLDELNSNLVERDLIIVGAGDSIGGSLYESAVNDDLPTKAITRLWGTQAQALGNHEFDKGYKDILKAAEDFKFPQLGANIVWKQKVDDGKEVGEVFMDATYIAEIKRGQRTYKIGFVGVTLESLPTVVLAEGVAPLEFTPAAPAANKYAKMLKEEENCDVVICLFHQGGLSNYANVDDFISDKAGDEFAEFLRLLNSEGKYVDVLASGHTHNLYNWNMGSTINPNLPPVVQTGSFGVNLATFDLLIDSQTHNLVVNPSGVDVATVRQDIYYDYDRKIWMRGVEGEDKELTDAEVKALPKLVDEVNKVIIQAVDQANEKGNVETAKSNVVWPKPSGTETILGRHIADAMLAATPAEAKVQIALTNDGGIRKEWVPTENNGITVRHVYDTLPFGNELVIMQLTGAELKSLLEYQWIAVGGVERSRMFHLQTSGLRYQYNETESLQKRIIEGSLEVYDASSEDFEPITPTGVYTLVTNNFLAGGRDNFVDFLKGTNRRTIATADNVYVMEYNQKMAAANDNYLVPATVESAFSVNSDLRSLVKMGSSSHRHGDHLHLTLTYTTSSPTGIKGPFRLLWTLDGKDEYHTVTPEQTSLTASQPLEVDLNIDGCSSKGCSLEATLMSEVFDRNPLPHGFTSTISLNKDGALASLAGLGLAGMITFLLA